MRLTIVCLLLFLSLGLKAQNGIDIVNTYLTKSEVSHLYIGIGNQIKIIGKAGVKYGLISSTGLSIKKTSIDNEFRVLASGAETYDTLKVTLAGKVVYKEVFKIKTIPNPIARVGDIVKGKVSIVELLAHPILTVSLPDCYLDLKYTITGFTFYWPKGNSLSCSGPAFCHNLILAINNLKKGDIVHFEDIILKGGPDHAGRAAPIKFIIE